MVQVGPGQRGAPALTPCRSQPQLPRRPQPQLQYPRRHLLQHRLRRPTIPWCAPVQRPRLSMPPATAGQYRPPKPSWRTERPPHTPPTSPRLPTSIRRCGRRTQAVNGTSGLGQRGAPALTLAGPNPNSHADPNPNSNTHADTYSNPDCVAQRYRGARRFNGRDHRCLRQPLDNILRQSRPGERKGRRIHRQRRRDCLRQ